jgi:hypothetical protein
MEWPLDLIFIALTGVQYGPIGFSAWAKTIAGAS